MTYFYSRLVSAFQDKFVGNNIKSSYIKFVRGDVRFSTFIQRILESSRVVPATHWNKHWRPFWLRCKYCDVTYKVIGKVETFDEDVKFIGRLANVDLKHIGEQCTDPPDFTQCDIRESREQRGQHG